MKKNSKNEAFVEITNKEIYDKLKEIEAITKNSWSIIKFHNRWLIFITSAFGASFIFVLSILLR